MSSRGAPLCAWVCSLGASVCGGLAAVSWILAKQRNKLASIPVVTVDEACMRPDELVAVRGVVHTHDPVKCTGSSVKAVAKEGWDEQQVVRAVGLRGILSREVVLLGRSEEHSRWFIRPEGSSEGAKAIVEGAEAAARSLMQVTYDSFEPMYSGNSGRAVGLRSFERSLPIGTRVTAVGLSRPLTLSKNKEVAISRGGGVFFVSREPLEQIIAKLSRSSGLFLFISIAAGTAAFAAAALAGATKLVERMRAKQKKQELAEYGVDPQKSCAVCFDMPLEVAFQCGHLCACFECGRRLSACPICRRPGDPLQIFVV